MHKNKVKTFSSPTYEGAKKGDSSYVMKIREPVPLCDDIMIEFFFKSNIKISKKVSEIVKESVNL